MSKTFAAGTTVLSTSDDRTANRVGTIVKSDHYCYLVDFGHGFHGHDGKNGMVNGTLWFCNTSELREVTLPAAAPKKAEKKAVKVDEHGKPCLAPQTRQVLELLKAKGSLTNLEAQGVLRVRALPRRIADLREAGYRITRVLSKDTTGQTYARYYLASGEPKAQAAA